MQVTGMVKPWVLDPPDEPCRGPDAVPQFWYATPPEFVHAPLPGLPSAEGRLIQTLLEAAQTKTAMTILTSAAVEFYWAGRPHAPGTPTATVALGNALADLAVTGRKAYQSWPVDEVLLNARTRPHLPAATPDAVAAAVSTALDRAYAVAWALRGPAASRGAARAGFHWIAVSGEDDSPHRPVNQPAPSIGGVALDHSDGVQLEQYSLDVTTHGIKISTRFFIASAVPDVVRNDVVESKRSLPPDPVPVIPGGHEVILFLHGHSSSAEEALPIIPYILAAGLARGKKYSVISFDLPNSGYAERFDHEVIPGPTTFPPNPGNLTQIRTPILDFTEDFVVAFVDALESITSVKARFAGVIGGSLGGNLGLRLGRRPDLTINPWLTAGIVSWSPASVWEPMVAGIFALGPDKALGGAYELETLRSRADYFYHAYDENLPDLELHKPGELWYSKYWTPCQTRHIEASRLARQEVYDANFRRWHWRLAAEQLIYSHVDRYIRHDNTSRYRFQDNTVRQFLVAGEDDDFGGLGRIFSSTQKLAGMMVDTPGRTLFLARTGHSIHVERPRFFAGEIVKFLAEAPSKPIGQARSGNAVALVRQSPGWTSIPVASANSDGSWKITNEAAPEFNQWAQQPGVQLVPGDFNGNGLTDIALVRQTPGWASIPIAFANGDGSWKITNGVAPQFADMLQQPGVLLVPGDFNGNGLTDIALVRQTPGWASIPIAFANGDGTWKITNKAVPEFTQWAQQPGVRVVFGDFDGDGRTDIALVRQTPGWASIPIAFANGDGTWTIYNRPEPQFADMLQQPGVLLVPGDFNGNGLTDIALVRQTPGWASIPIAFANGDGTWKITNEPAPEFNQWAQQPGVQLVPGDFNGNGRTDIALVRQTPGWASIPIASATDDGSWTITNVAVPEFNIWAQQPGVRLLVGTTTAALQMPPVPVDNTLIYEVPEVSEGNLANAVKLVIDAGLRPVLSGTGNYVYGQSPQAGTMVKHRDPVTLYVRNQTAN